MKYNIFGYLIGEGFSNVFKNKKSTGASLMIMCATMLIFGLFLVIGENINAFVKSVADAQGIMVYLKTGATDEEIEQVGKDILQIDGVRDAKYISNTEGLESMRETLGDKMIEGYTTDNILPASYEVTLTDLELSSDVQESLKQIPNVDDIRSSNIIIEQIIRLAKGIKIVTWVILVLLIIISTAIISNTIKLTVHARRKEISIMKYVGATNNFIRWPFIVEGMIIGILASVISIVIVGGAYSLLAEQAVNANFMQTINMSLVGFKDMISSIIVVYMLLGIGIGALGSVISMRKYLKV